MCYDFHTLYAFAVVCVASVNITVYIRHSYVLTLTPALQSACMPWHISKHIPGGHPPAPSPQQWTCYREASQAKISSLRLPGCRVFFAEDSRFANFPWMPLAHISYCLAFEKSDVSVILVLLKAVCFFLFSQILMLFLCLWFQFNVTGGFLYSWTIS